jgi:hypothetical protein
MGAIVVSLPIRKSREFDAGVVGALFGLSSSR